MLLHEHSAQLQCLKHRHDCPRLHRCHGRTPVSTKFARPPLRTMKEGLRVATRMSSRQVLIQQSNGKHMPAACLRPKWGTRSCPLASTNETPEVDLKVVVQPPKSASTNKCKPILSAELPTHPTKR